MKIWKIFEKFLNKGFMGEEIASLYLIDKGYTIVERNWKCIVAKKDGFLCFIEVKRKLRGETFQAEFNFTEKKRKKLINLIDIYMKNKRLQDLPHRLELVAINERGLKRVINHYINL